MHEFTEKELKEFIKLEGTEVIVTNFEGKEFNLIVAGCEYDIGITLTYNDGENKGDAVVCLIRRDFTSEDIYYNFFVRAISCINRKYFSLIELQSPLNARIEYDLNDFCPFR